MRTLRTFSLVVVVMALVLVSHGTGRTDPLLGPVRADALVLVNSSGASYGDFQHFVKPNLDHFDIPYTVRDIATTAVGTDASDYAVIIIGHRDLDPGGICLDPTEQADLTSAVNLGTGIDSAEAADLSVLTHAGLATVAIQAYDGSFFYFDHGAGANFPDATVAANFAAGAAWHTANNIPISRYVLPHYYEFGSNVFGRPANWGVELVGTQMDPDQIYGAPWVRNGPFRLYENGNSGAGQPQYYADYMAIPGHPELDGKFFNCVTELRDDLGYEWYPNLGDVACTVYHGTLQTKRALDAMALATRFTHGTYRSSAWPARFGESNAGSPPTA